MDQPAPRRSRHGHRRPAEAVEFVRNDDIQVISFPRGVTSSSSLSIPARRHSIAGRAARAERRCRSRALDRKRPAGPRRPSTGPIWPKHWAYDPIGSTVQLSIRAVATSLLDALGLRRSRQDRRRSAGARFAFTCLLPGEFQPARTHRPGSSEAAVQHRRRHAVRGRPDRGIRRRIRDGRFEAVLIDMISGPTLGAAVHVLAIARADSKGSTSSATKTPRPSGCSRLLRTSTNEARGAVGDQPPAARAARRSAGAVPRVERASPRRQRDFQVVREPDRDPLFTIWQWTENTDQTSVSTQ